MCSRKELILVDPESNIQHTFYLNDSDFNRATTDDRFAYSLLCSQKEEVNEEGALNNSTADTVLNESLETPYETKHSWQYNETKVLINSVASHLENFDHPKKRKNVFNDVVNDMLSAGFTVTAVQAQVKWKSLIRSYKIAKDTKNRSGRGPSRFMFFDEMDEILGNKPSNSCEHALASTFKDSSNLEVPAEGAEQANPEDEEETHVPDEQPDFSKESQTGPPQEKKRRTSQKTVTQSFINMKKEEYQRRQKRHEEKLAIENRKLQLLEQYLNMKQN